MPATAIRGVQILNGSVQRADLNTATSGQAVVTKIVQGTNITIASSGIDPGTGDVTVSATVPAVDPGTWTVLTYATGWSEWDTARFRVETNGSVQTVFCKGRISQAAGSAPFAFTFPAGARPATARGTALCGVQVGDGDDNVLYTATVGTDGVVDIYPMVKHCFVWPIETDQQVVYLDGLTFSL